MRLRNFICVLALALALAAPGGHASAAEAKVAIASNFAPVMKDLQPLFTERTGHTLKPSFGSAGLLYAKIKKGAPYEVLLGAAQKHPRRAVADGFGVPDSGFTYAVGRLVLFSVEEGMVEGWQTLDKGTFSKLAIANPKTEPYGAASLEVMASLGLVEKLTPKFVRTNNVSQTYQFVVSGIAQLGFVGTAQVARVEGGSRWEVPSGLHSPILQEAVLLRAGEANPAATAFLAFLRAPETREVIASFGYGLPE